MCVDGYLLNECKIESSVFLGRGKQVDACVENRSSTTNVYMLATQPYA